MVLYYKTFISKMLRMTVHYMSFIKHSSEVGELC